MPLYFIGIIAPVEVNRQVLQWKNYMQQQFNCNKALRLPAHITLISPFDMRPELEGSLALALERFARQQSVFPIHLRDFSAFAPRVIYVQVEPDRSLLQLKEDLEAFLIKTNQFPIRKEERPFHPHITIASRDLKKSDFAAAWQYFNGRSYEAVFETGTISLLAHTGDRWSVVADYPFG